MKLHYQKFKDYPGKSANNRKTTFDGMATIAQTGPDYDKSLETFVVLDIKTNKDSIFKDDQEIELRDWLAVHPLYSKEIASKITDI